MIDFERHCERAKLAKHRPLSPNSKTPSLDRVIQLTGLIFEVRHSLYSVDDQAIRTLRESFNEHTSFFDDPCPFDIKDDSQPYKWYELSLNLDNELRDFFRDKNESTLQNRDASYMADYLVELILPTLRHERIEMFNYLPEDFQKYNETNGSFYFKMPDEQPERDNMGFTSNLSNALHTWSTSITEHIRLYAPEVFQQHRKEIYFYFNNVTEDNNNSSAQLSKVPSNLSLQWKGDKTDLAELVWVLSKSNRITDNATGQPVTQKELTRKFETLFGLTLDVTGLMKGRMNTYKATSNGNTFTKTLLDLIKERAANS